MIQVPHGELNPIFDDGVADPYEPTLHCIMVPEDNDKTTVLNSIYTGEGWIRSDDQSKEWLIELKSIGYDEYFDNIVYLRGKTITFTPHKDAPAETYTCIVTYVRHDYDDGYFARDNAIMKLITESYKDEGVLTFDGEMLTFGGENLTFSGE